MREATLLLLLTLAGSTSARAQEDRDPLAPRVDERVELLSITYTLARGKSVASPNPRYASAIRDHFRRHAGHPFIAYLKRLSDSAATAGGDLGSWELPSLALHLGPPPRFEPLVAAADSALADGWDDRTLLTPVLLSLLRRFWADAACEAFFAAQRPYYARVAEAYATHGIPVDDGWVRRFVALSPTERYRAVVGLHGLGLGDYIRVNFPENRRDTYTIIGDSLFDAMGLPRQPASPMIARSSLHEYIHAFTNQLVDRNLASLQEPAATMLAQPRVTARVKDTFYGNWQFLMYESLVRAISIKYLAEHREIDTSREREIGAQERAGFFWMRGLVEQLDRYQQDRTRYPTLEAFMPELLRYFAGVAEAMEQGRFPFPDA